MFKQTDTIAAFGPPLLVIECVQCNRRGQMQLHTVVRRFGMITIADLLRRVAEDGGCPLVARNQCTAIVQPTPVTYWAKLSNAQDNGWRPVLVCQRRHYALKRVRPCPAVALDLTTLVGTTVRTIDRDELMFIQDADR
ncbi:hypothetical protein GCM10007989_14060 [Devosia pacifica]|uniref:Uncharacterized protein n=1 Tax=Devosia pacifica TaxID=1335967 RepID=A0A918S1U1_9HYPH|nr:hypothetical protein [Devosia pacifica]GHA19648.1 hypothetical protein GCM10007989_14060 [Devosia pacifica]